ncbi:MAG: diadenylate cyclase CdaA [Clostridia bacterium]|nr:diadenylate cyclase CdaA [Clostridia bacterium]
MFDNFLTNVNTYYQQNIVNYFREIYQYPIKLVPVILDLLVVGFLIYKFFFITKDSRAKQLIKGIFIYILFTAISSVLHLTIINYILRSFLSYGVVILIVIFQPELRRALEQLGSNKFTKFIGIEKDKYVQTKEDIYKIVIATMELAKSKTGALIVLEKDIKIKDIIESGIEINSFISPQLLVNLFVPNTPLHDGAVIISENKLVAAACILPLASDQDIAKELGTRHRAALGMAKESDAVIIVVSEETGKVSLARNGILLVDIKEDTLKQILIKDFAEIYNTKEKVGNKIKNRKINIKKKIKKVEE